MKKRILSILLCFVFLLSMLPGVTLADSETAGEPTPAEETTPAGEPAPTETTPNEEPAPAAETTLTEEPAPAAEATPTEEPTPAAETTPTVEPVNAPTASAEPEAGNTAETPTVAPGNDGATLTLDTPVLICRYDQGCYPYFVWSSIEGAGSYDLYYWDSDANDFVKFYSTICTEYMDTSIELGGVYYYEVKAVSSSGDCSDFSNCVEVNTAFVAPVIRGSLNQSGYPVLTWNAVPGAIGYAIYYNDGFEYYYKYCDVAYGTTYTDNDVSLGSFCAYVVAAIYEGYCEGPISNNVNVVTHDTALAAPVVTGSLDQSGYPVLTWNAVPGATCYCVFHWNDYAQCYVPSDSITTGTTYTDIDISFGSTYRYVVAAACDDGNCFGPYSNEVTITPKTADGWKQIYGDYYYFLNNTIQTGWLTLNGSKYYLNPNDYGAMVTGWKTIDGKTYYFKGGSSGRMLTGWQFIGGLWYYFNASDGHMLTGWQTIGTGRYYLDPANGAMATGWKTISGKTYYFKDGDSGRLLTGWQQIGTKWYYFNTSDGHMLTGWQTIGTGRYYLDPTKGGAMLTGWQKVDGAWHYFKGGSSGRLLTGWQLIGTGWFYLDPQNNGAMLMGLKKVGTGTYYFNPVNESGRMLTGWQKIDGAWHYFKGGDSGRMLTGWQTIGTGRYYLDPTTGVMATGWKTIGGVTYYFKPGDSGRMVTGTYTIDGVCHTFSSSGKMVS